MAANLKLQVLLAAIDRASGPLKRIMGGSSGAAIETAPAPTIPPSGSTNPVAAATVTDWTRLYPADARATATASPSGMF